jgi:radical SAM superfamily enzyme YgiQ (UPF0313 family)
MRSGTALLAKESLAELNEIRAAAYFERRFPGRKLDRVLLVTPPDATAEIFDPAVARRGTYSNFPPYGLAVLAQHLRADGLEVEILNLNHAVLKSCHEAPSSRGFDFDAAWQHPLVDALDRFKPQLVGVTCMFTMTHDSLKRVCAFIAERNLPVVIGGVHVSNDVEKVLDDIPAADMAVVREGDVAFRRLVHVIRDEEPVHTLGQTIIRDDGQGRLHLMNECMPTAEQLDVIPAFDLIDVVNLSRYGVIGSFHCFKPKGTRFATVLSNRGCRGSCTFCSVRSFNGRDVRSRSVESVLDELQMLEEVYGIEHIMWLDDDLLKDHRRAIELFNGMVHRGLKLTWDASNGVIAYSCTDEVIAAVAASRCIGIIIGMESGNPKILRDIRKPGTVQNFLRAAEVLRKYESIYSSVYLIIGFPDETMSMIKDTIRVSLEMDLDWYRIKPLQPLPGTPIYDSMIERGLIERQEGTKVRYVTGAYGRHLQDEEGRLPPASIEQVLDAIPDDVVPTPMQIDDVWFYMNYALNYRRVLAETRPIKLRQHLQFNRAICDLISPDNPFALYTSARLARRLDNEFDAGRFQRLAKQLDSAPFWNVRFRALGLSLDDFGPVEPDQRSLA